MIEKSRMISGKGRFNRKLIMLRRMFRLLPDGLKPSIMAWHDALRTTYRYNRSIAHMRSVASAISGRCLSGIETIEDWHRQRPVLRQQMLYMLGLEQMPSGTKVLATVTGTVSRSRYRIEKLVFESLPGFYVTANFYLPHESPSPAPCVIYLNGHWPSLDGAKVGFQDRYLWYPANGFALLVIDPIGFGEIPGVHGGMHRLNWWHWLSLGYTPAGVEVWNAMRIIDWLETQSEVDASRIGVTGISGGGVMTQYLAAIDERVAVAAPSCSTYTIGNQVAQSLIQQQCDCTFYPNVYGIDFPEVLALIAPRPLLILGGRKDPIFPPAGFREAFQRATKIYSLFQVPCGPGPRIRLIESDQAHTDPPHFLLETRRWMCRWLGVDIGAADMNAQPEPERPSILRCSERIPAFALNYHIHDVWIRRPSLAVPLDRESWDRRKESILGVLRTRVFGWFPQTGAPFRTRRIAASGSYAGDLADFGEFEFDSEPGVPVKCCLLTPKSQCGPVPVIIWIRGVSGQVSFPDIDEFFPLLHTHALAIVTPRFAERILTGNDYAKIERTASLIGRSIASLQVWDALRTVAWVTRDRSIEPSGIAVYGRGSAGIAGLYAALFDSTIGHVVLRDPPVSHIDGPALPTILRDTDIQEVAGCLVPSNLTILSQSHIDFELTKAIFNLVGADTALHSAYSITEALLDVRNRCRNEKFVDGTCSPS